MSDSLWFSEVVADKLRFYVYRLIDPRNDETFYVGKGTGNRVFAHAKGDIDTGEEALSGKLQRIRDIRQAGLDVIHLIHRHDMDESTAFEVEAALIDAYPNTENLVSGHSSDDRGLMTVRQILERYEAEEAIFQHSAVIINVGRLIKKKPSIYDVVHYAWVIDVKRAQSAELILAVDRGLIVGVFIAEIWLSAILENFPEQENEFPNRWGFRGREAPDEIASLYVGRRIPERLRKRGAANPIRYI
ncbi:MAG: hypothetical protein B7Z75_09560 [Acidocella sp. 20-57-95]|nr:MAG: hypothetical protein B7Z75_09560 [Acidocella sp. 20-57-95]OYV59530.1 MAG: hypothetical protein B7Z71_07915 [Acidocella sp. 21-58-7]HQT65160.1 hypothetical protein [Acidocella sp.]HQU04565.1 hypothetical protein [Acidocella sp.]